MAIEKVREYFKKWNMEDRILELSIEELEQQSNAESWVDVCKDWQE